MRKFTAVFFLSFIFSTAVLAAQPIAYGPTTHNDQLWQIAVSLRPNTSVTVEQTMLAILKTNPDAFSDANAYQLKPGYVLAIPTVGVIKQVSIENAAKQIKRQHNVFLGIEEKSVVENIEKVKKGENKKLNSKKKLNNESKDNKEQVKQLITEEFDKKIAVISQQYQEQLNAMEQQNQALQVKINEVNSNLDNLQQKMKQEAEESEREKQNKFFKLPAFLKNYTKSAQGGGNFFSADELKLLAAVALMLIIWWSLLHYKRSKLEDSKFKSEYDFMSGEEGMNTKLDLAQAYIDMSDKESARKVLAEVIRFGDSKQKAEAEELLKKCA